MATAFKNPSNGYVEEVGDLTWLWCLLFGAFFFAYKNVWAHFVIGLGAALVTAGISWLVYPFFARSIVENHYRRNGWIEVSLVRSRKSGTINDERQGLNEQEWRIDDRQRSAQDAVKFPRT